MGCNLLELQNSEFSGLAIFMACHSAVLGPNLKIHDSPSAHLAVETGYLVGIRNGFEVQGEGSLSIYIDPDRLP
jgi:hypothetical protein